MGLVLCLVIETQNYSGPQDLHELGRQQGYRGVEPNASAGATNPNPCHLPASSPSTPSREQMRR